jgi:hypothetical protein
VVAEETEGAVVTDEIGSTAGIVGGGRPTVLNGLEVFRGRRKGNGHDGESACLILAVDGLNTFE